MAKVTASRDIRDASEHLIACKGREGVALRNRVPWNKKNMGKVPVRWQGTRRIYWLPLDHLTFVDSSLDPLSFVVRLAEDRLCFPELPRAGQPNRAHFGRNLKRFRQLRDLRQAELAEKAARPDLPISQTAISHWERQQFAPNGRYVLALAEALDVLQCMFFVDMENCTTLSKFNDYLKRLVAATCEEAIA
jgi:transcriptional regulator with XRE-family HTH domain